MSDDRVLSLAPFLALVRELSALLLPARPRPAFREALAESLLVAAKQMCALQALDIAAPAPQGSQAGAIGRERRWVIGVAAVGSAVSVAGLIAYLWHQRSQRAA